MCEKVNIISVYLYNEIVKIGSKDEYGLGN